MREGGREVEERGGRGGEGEGEEKGKGKGG